MSKRNSKRKYKYSGDERLLMALHDVAKKTDDAEIRATTCSLLRWYQRQGSWTGPQKDLIRKLINGHKKTKAIRASKEKPCYSLYAARIGDILKVGFSSNVNSRIKSYQTSAKDVELIAVVGLGQCSAAEARRNEKKLHKHIAKHRIEREMFELDALDEIRLWAIGNPQNVL